MDIVIISVAAGAGGWSDIFQFAEDPQDDWFKAFLELPAGIPCDDMFRCVFRLDIFLSMPQTVVERTLLPGLARVSAEQSILNLCGESTNGDQRNRFLEYHANHGNSSKDSIQPIESTGD
jgi:hypothetical protein